ncbi:hypothetical protein RBWH47_05002 [Rhodopirellula baltica WH47]|uniref:Uncharacterized protein n=1 Tax=Rhodopirellula baltica WH47 TaxID=991778 RepID=F2AU38_RHOBT|nr:hypothetical protein RBWH47_05002 [Rhodopirellula baltica WH47]
MLLDRRKASNGLIAFAVLQNEDPLCSGRLALFQSIGGGAR